MIGAQTGSKFMFGCELHDLSYEPRGQTWDQTRTAQVNVLKETRVEEEMLKLRQRNYKWLARCFSHLGLLGGLGILCEAGPRVGVDFSWNMPSCSQQGLLFTRSWEVHIVTNEVECFFGHISPQILVSFGMINGS